MSYKFFNASKSSILSPSNFSYSSYLSSYSVVEKDSSTFAESISNKNIFIKLNLLPFIILINSLVNSLGIKLK